MEKRNKCICCGYFTLIEDKEDIWWDICPVCYWENDIVGTELDEYSGANHMTLRQGQDNYRIYFSCDVNMAKYVRPPKKEELPEYNL